MMRKKTTLYIDERQDRATKALAREQGRSQAEIIREAIDAFVNDVRVKPKSIGIGHSGDGESIRDKKHEWLKDFGEWRSS